MTILVVVGIIVVGGVVGGWAAYLSAQRAPDGPPPSFRPFLVLGVTASACVPLFLSLVRSNLVDEIFRARQGQPFEEYLVLLGLCLVAAFSARAFIESVSSRIIRDLETVREENQSLREDVLETRELVDDQGSQQLSQEAIAPTEMVDESDLPPVSDAEIRALRAMMNASYRTATGIANDIGIARHRIGEMLDSLASKGLVERTISPNTRGQRWRITPIGVAALNRGRS
jgi:DNA-binding MarR family transcriptional regulator